MPRTDWDTNPAEIKEPRRSGQKAKEVTSIKTTIGVHADVPVILRKRPVVGNAKPQRFFSFHHHSTFSYLDGYCLPDAHVRRITELNMAGLAMTEHGNIDSHTQFERAAKKAGIKSVFGCEVYMPATPTGEGETQRKHHLTLIARNAEGYRNLIKLVTLSWKNFYYDPVVTMSMLKRHRRGLICLSGCQGSLLSCSTVGGKGIDPKDATYHRGLGVARMFKAIFGRWYFIEVQAFPELEKTRLFNGVAGKLARAIGTKLVATMDCHYTQLEEAEVQKILHNLRPGTKKTIEEQAREWGYDVPLCPPPNDRSIYRRLRASGLSDAEAIQAIVTTEELAQECDVELPKLPMVKFPLPESWDSEIDYWRHLLKKGWKFRGLDKLRGAARKRYTDQLKHEMGLIEGKGFVNYFLLVQAGVVHIKDDHGIPVGPARGSAAASVAAYLLRITEVDPLRPDYAGLLRFERFIDESREDLPDIDLDFPSRARPLLRAFYERMFGGSDFVTNVGTFIYFRNKIALDDVARVFHVPKWEVEKVKSYLIERSSGDLRASSTIEDTVAQFPAAKEVVDKYPDLQKGALLEGGIKGFGVHAAALVLSNDPITTVTPLMEREVPKGSGNIIQVVGLDKHDAEYRGLLKMDFLGLNTMSMIEDMIEHPLVRMNINELYGLPLTDPKVFDRFEANDVVGVFQWDGRATRFVNGSVKPRVFRELMDINALCRPGPLHGGSTREYIETKQGKREPESIHPALDIITAPTQYQIVYQEQILQILRTVGDFPWGVTAEIRKIISKKIGEQAFNKKHDQFLDGARKVHKRLSVPPMPDEVIEKIWRRMITAGAYAFNAAHCASYSLIAYWCMWMKVYHPSVFYYAALKNLGDDKRKELIRDAESHSIRILPPHVRRSRATWHTRDRRAVRAGFEQVHGIGEKTAPLIVKHRIVHKFTRWEDLKIVKGIGPKTCAKIKAFAEKDDPFDVYKLERNIEEVKRQIKAGKLGTLPPPTHSGSTMDANEGKELPVVWLGTITKRNVRDLFEYTLSKTGEELDPASVKDPDLREWVVCRGEDDTEPVMLKINRWRYPRFKDAVMGAEMDEDLVLVEGKRPAFAGTRQINVERLWVIDMSEDEDEVDAPAERKTRNGRPPAKSTEQTSGRNGRPRRHVRRQTEQVGQSVHSHGSGNGSGNGAGGEPRGGRSKTRRVAAEQSGSRRAA